MSIEVSSVGSALRPSERAAYKRFYKPALVEAGLDPELRFHDLRHTSASIAGSREYAGETAKVVQHLLRHSSQQVTTEVYMHLFPEDLDRLRDGLDRVYAEATGDADLDDHGRERGHNTVVSFSTGRGRRATG